MGSRVAKSVVARIFIILSFVLCLAAIVFISAGSLFKWTDEKAGITWGMYLVNVLKPTELVSKHYLSIPGWTSVVATAAALLLSSITAGCVKAADYSIGKNDSMANMLVALIILMLIIFLFAFLDKPDLITYKDPIKNVTSVSLFGTSGAYWISKNDMTVFKETRTIAGWVFCGAAAGFSGIAAVSTIVVLFKAIFARNHDK